MSSFQFFKKAAKISFYMHVITRFFKKNIFFTSIIYFLTISSFCVAYGRDWSPGAIGMDGYTNKCICQAPPLASDPTKPDPNGVCMCPSVQLELGYSTTHYPNIECDDPTYNTVLNWNTLDWNANDGAAGTSCFVWSYNGGDPSKPKSEELSCYNAGFNEAYGINLAVVCGHRD